MQWQQSSEQIEWARFKYLGAKIFIASSAVAGVFMLGNLGYEAGKQRTENQFIKGGLIANSERTLDVDALQYYCELERYVGAVLPERCVNE